MEMCNRVIKILSDANVTRSTERGAVAKVKRKISIALMLRVDRRELIFNNSNSFTFANRPF